MNGDVFNKEVSYKNKHEDADNFFLQSEYIIPNKSLTEPSRRLNDYDFNILKEEAYKDVSDELFKLEYKIAKLEEELKFVDRQLQAANDINDYATADNLYNRKIQLQEDLNGLVEIYNDTSLSAKISGGITNKIKQKINVLKKACENTTDILLSKLPGKFSTILEVKNSLKKLENINKSVDELMTLQTPYGESTDKYEQLSKYIVKANIIQTEISKHIH